MFEGSGNAAHVGRLCLVFRAGFCNPIAFRVTVQVSHMPLCIQMDISCLFFPHMLFHTEHSQVRFLVQPRAWLCEVEEIRTKTNSNLFP